MSKSTRKRREKQIEARLNLVLLTFAALGWFITKTIIGTLIAGFIGIVLLISFTIWRKVKYKKRLRNSGIEDIDAMDGVQFEYYLKELFLSRGYKVNMTKTIGDFGADLVLEKEGNKIVVQAKRYSKPVGIKAVQEVISAINVYGASEAWVVTNSTYTKAAIELAERNAVKMIGREGLIDFINQLSPNQNPNPNDVKQRVKQNTKKKCDICGSEMIIRKGPRGIFLGCSSFPKCKFTKETV